MRTPGRNAGGLSDFACLRGLDPGSSARRQSRPHRPQRLPPQAIFTNARNRRAKRRGSARDRDQQTGCGTAGRGAGPRPSIGIIVDRWSGEHPVVRLCKSGSPAVRGGLRPGDVPSSHPLLLPCRRPGACRRSGGRPVASRSGPGGGSPPWRAWPRTLPLLVRHMLQVLRPKALRRFPHEVELHGSDAGVQRIVHLSKTRQDCNFGHVFHNVFVDLYYLQMINQPAGAYVLDDYWWRGALRQLAISRPIWAGGRMLSRTARRERCGCPINRWHPPSRS